VTSVPFDVPINDDNILEEAENFYLTIIHSSVLFRISPSRALVTILDDEGNCFVPLMFY